MAAVTICGDFGAQENKMSLFPLFHHLLAMKWWDWMPWSLFFECWVLSQLFHSPLLPSSRGSLAPLHFLPLEWYHLYICTSSVYLYVICIFKRHFLLGRKAMTKLDSILKSRDITLPVEVHLVKSIVFPIVMYGYDSWTIKKAECWRIDAFELWC